MPLRCMIVDDNPSYLAAAVSMLERQGATILGVATTAADGLRRAEELDPDVILVDISLGADSGLELAWQLAGPDRAAHASVILISAHPEDDFAELVADTPALGFIPKSELSRMAIEDLLRRRPPVVEGSVSGPRDMR